LNHRVLQTTAGARPNIVSSSSPSYLGRRRDTDSEDDDYGDHGDGRNGRDGYIDDNCCDSNTGKYEDCDSRNDSCYGYDGYDGDDGDDGCDGYDVYGQL